MIALLLASAGSLQASPLDPIDLAGQMSGSTWKQVMKEFRRLDTNEDGRLSRDERDLYHIQDEAQQNLPLTWTTGVTLVWDDNVFTRAEFLAAAGDPALPATRAASRGATVVACVPQGGTGALTRLYS